MIEKLQESYKKDIKIAIDVWKSILLSELGEDSIECIFTKGSSVKLWESDIDYVPILSDVDIHLKVKDKRKKILEGADSFAKGLKISENYNKLFFETCGKIIYSSKHLPRVEIVQLNAHGRKGYVVPPRAKDLHIIYGKMKYQEEMDHNDIRKMDKKSLINEKNFIETFPNKFFELSGIDYYSMLYRLNVRVSPSPIKLLTQINEENPHDLWSLNKTSVRKVLEESGYAEIAKNFEEYYKTGWKLFESNFTNPNLYRQMIKCGYTVLTECYNEILKLN
jgi:hypothetical protein